MLCCPPPREYCAEDIEELCHDQREAIALASAFAADAQVITCLEVGPYSLLLLPLFSASYSCSVVLPRE